MPLYTYECHSCKERQDAFRPMADRDEAPACACGGESVRVITPVRFNSVMGGASNPGYHCVVEDKWVSSVKERKEIMAKHDLIEAG